MNYHAVPGGSSSSQASVGSLSHSSLPSLEEVLADEDDVLVRRGPASRLVCRTPKVEYFPSRPLSSRDKSDDDAGFPLSPHPGRGSSLGWKQGVASSHFGTTGPSPSSWSSFEEMVGVSELSFTDDYCDWRVVVKGSEVHTDAYGRQFHRSDVKRAFK